MLGHQMRPTAFFVLFLVAVLSAGGAELRLIDAVKAENRDAIRALLKNPVRAREVNEREADGTTALHWAARSGATDIARMLLNAGAAADPANRYGLTPMMLAAEGGHRGIVEVLMHAGADVNAALPQGETVLMTASRAGNADVVKALLDHDAKVDASDGQLGETALMWAAAH